MSDVNPADLLVPGSIRLGVTAADRAAAIDLCGGILVDTGAVSAPYVAAMHEREATLTTHIGAGVAIPHATLAGKEAVVRDGLCFVRFDEPIDWGGNPVTVCIGIAAKGDGHVDILAQLAQILVDPERAQALRTAQDEETVLRMLTPGSDDEGE